MDAILRAFEEELTSAAQAAVQGVVARAKGEVARLLEAANKEREAGVREVEQKRRELAMEVAAMHKVSVAQDSRVELEVGGVQFVTSVATLRSRAGSMLDALFSGRYSVDVAEDGVRAFLDRDGELFGHVPGVPARGSGGCRAGGRRGDAAPSEARVWVLLFGAG